MAIVTILGAGRMGTALCTPLLDAGHEVRLVGTHLDAARIDALRSTGTHPELGVPTSPGAAYLRVDGLGDAMIGADFVVVGVSAEGVRWAARALGPHLAPSIPVIMLTKGVEWSGTRFRLMPQVFAELLPKPYPERIGAVSGPCLAAELAQRVPTTVVISGATMSILRDWTEVTQTDYYHVIASQDVIGNQLAAALKNTYAIALGLVDPRTPEAETGHAQGAGFNYESAVFSGAISEIGRLVEIAGGSPRTVCGFSGVGDLLVTMHGRNHALGTILQSGGTWASGLARMQGATLEGPFTLKQLAPAVDWLENRKIIDRRELPLLRHLIQRMEGTAGPSVPWP